MEEERNRRACFGPAEPWAAREPYLSERNPDWAEALPASCRARARVPARDRGCSLPATWEGNENHPSSSKTTAPRRRSAAGLRTVRSIARSRSSVSGAEARDTARPDLAPPETAPPAEGRASEEAAAAPP